MSCRSMCFWSCVLLLSAGASSAAEAEAWSDAEVGRILEERIDRYQKSVGIVVGLLDAQGSRIVARGKPGGPSERPLDGDTVFEIGSVSKVFTTTLLADMVEHGELGLDDPISRLLPAAVKVPAVGGHEITLLHLATHSSGLPRLPDNLVPADDGNPYADYTVEQMYAFLRSPGPGREPGARTEYSNLGVGLLGHLLGLKSGAGFEALVHQRITGPLGMAHTAVSLSPEMQARLAPGHGRGLEPVKNWDLPTLAGAGALRSTANDMLRFLGANLELVESSLQPAMRRARAPQRDFTIPGTKIGLGWVLQSGHGADLVWHNGETGGYHSFAGFDLAGRRGVVVLSNSSNDIDDIGLHLLAAGYELAKLEPPRTATKLDLAAADAYAGRYQLGPGFILTFTREGEHCFVEATGQGKTEVFPESPTKFFAKAVDAQISFVRDEAGKVDQLVLHQGGLDQKAKRLAEGEQAASFGPAESLRLPAEKLQRYVGRYELVPGFDITVSREGERLLAQATGQAALEIFAESETKFFYKAVDARLIFVVGPGGVAESLTLDQGGRQTPGKRLD